jgi:hypothetical protein
MAAIRLFWAGGALVGEVRGPCMLMRSHGSDPDYARYASGVCPVYTYAQAVS